MATGVGAAHRSQDLTDELDGFLKNTRYLIMSGLSEGENDDGKIVCSERLGGVLKHFHRAAA